MTRQYDNMIYMMSAWHDRGLRNLKTFVLSFAVPTPPPFGGPASQGECQPQVIYQLFDVFKIIDLFGQNTTTVLLARKTSTNTELLAYISLNIQAKFQLCGVHCNHVIGKTTYGKLQSLVWVRHIGVSLWYTNMAAEKVSKEKNRFSYCSWEYSKTIAS